VISISVPSEESSSVASRRRSFAVDAAIILASAAALAHGVTTPEHLRWWAASGVFFALLAVVQGALAIALLRRSASDRLLLAGVWGTVAVITLYVLSRTVAIPFAPEFAARGSRWVPGRSIVPGAEKLVGTFDVITLIVELVLVMLLTGLMTPARRQRTAALLLWFALVLWGLVGLAVL
jgi:hypothetical protein